MTQLLIAVLLLQVFLLLLPPKCIHVFCDFRVCPRVVQARVTPGPFNLHTGRWEINVCVCGGGGVCMWVCMCVSERESEQYFLDPACPTSLNGQYVEVRVYACVHLTMRLLTNGLVIHPIS